MQRFSLYHVHKVLPWTETTHARTEPQQRYYIRTATRCAGDNDLLKEAGGIENIWGKILKDPNGVIQARPTLSLVYYYFYLANTWQSFKKSSSIQWIKRRYFHRISYSTRYVCKTKISKLTSKSRTAIKNVKVMVMVKVTIGLGVIWKGLKTNMSNLYHFPFKSIAKVKVYFLTDRPKARFPPP